MILNPGESAEIEFRVPWDELPADTQAALERGATVTVERDPPVGTAEDYYVDFWFVIEGQRIAGSRMHFRPVR
jgi:hypothetical protein